MIILRRINRYQYSHLDLYPKWRHFTCRPTPCNYANIDVKSNKNLNDQLPGNANKVEDWEDTISRWYRKYQDFVGITEILEAQEKVNLLTNQLLNVQSNRRHLQRDVEQIHQQLLSTHQRITKSELYSEDHFSLFEKARELNVTLKKTQRDLTAIEEEERSLFTQLSAFIKHCHAKERTQSEQSKYWSILISVISACVASLITSINNWVRIKEIKDHASLLHASTLAKLTALSAEFGGAINDSDTGSEGKTSAIIQTIRTTIQEEFTKEIQSLLDSSSEQSVPNVNQSETRGSLLNHESQIESHMKSRTYLITGVIAGAALTAYSLWSFRG